MMPTIIPDCAEIRLRYCLGGRRRPLGQQMRPEGWGYCYELTGTLPAFRQQIEDGRFELQSYALRQPNGSARHISSHAYGLYRAAMAGYSPRLRIRTGYGLSAVPSHQ